MSTSARSVQTATAEGVHPSDPDGIGVFDGPSGGSVLICDHEDSGAGSGTNTKGPRLRLRSGSRQPRG